MTPAWSEALHDLLLSLHEAPSCGGVRLGRGREGCWVVTPAWSEALHALDVANMFRRDARHVHAKNLAHWRSVMLSTMPMIGLSTSYLHERNMAIKSLAKDDSDAPPAELLVK